MTVPASRRLNEVFILSAICMIFGLFALNGSLDFSPMPARNLLGLIFVLNIYEILTLGIAWLLNKRRIDLDAKTLVIIESLFLFDGAFLTSELITISPKLGVAVAIVLIVAGIAKAAVMLRIGGERLMSRSGAMAMTMMFALLAIPWLMKTISTAHAGVLTQAGYYAGWCLAAVVPIAAAILWRRESRKLIHAMLGLGFVSVIAHISTEAWVNRVPFSLTDLSPVVIGLAIWIGNARLFPVGLRSAIAMELALPVLAVLLAAGDNVGVRLPLWGVTFTPLRIALLAAAAVYVHGLVRHHDWRFGVGLAGGMSVAAAGSNPQAIASNGVKFVQSIFDIVASLIPRTLTQWGWASVTSAFALLLGGAVRSLRTPVAVQHDDAN